MVNHSINQNKNQLVTFWCVNRCDFMQTVVNWWIQFFRRVFDEELENINLKKKIMKKIMREKKKR